MADNAEFSDFFYSAPDGLRLHARVYGAANTGKTPVICLPGLTRNARDFHELSLHLSRANARKVAAFDYRGRGRSAYDKNWRNYNLNVEADDILAGLTALEVEHGAFIGTSRGGLIIHLLAAMRPAVLRAVVLNDIGPVVEAAGFARIRAYLETAPKPRSFDEALAMQRSLHGKAFPALSGRDWRRFVAALYRDRGGVPVPDFDPALLKTLSQLDLSVPLPTMWPQFQGLYPVPVLAIRGEHSTLLSAQTLQEMEQRHPRLEALTVSGQGHAPLLETGELPNRIAEFLDRADGTAG
ncbi:alpha/beta hydrolase [Mesorhizobium sp. KR2-14]|uniref:alpha/beta fold hydrolase n=1 Tax=Mesorhizobium sp. KR2-14 TaxID=3156610 RepID=UPI0032B47EAC